MALPCLRDDSPRDEISEPNDEAAFLQAIGIAKARGLDWLGIKPEDRPDWARWVLAQEAEGTER